MSTLHLAVSLFFSSVMVLLVLLMRKLLKSQLTPTWTYNLWFVFLLALLLPYLPAQLLNSGSPFMENENPGRSLLSAGTPAENIGLESGKWMQDFSLSVNRTDLTFSNQVFTIIWISGVFMMGAFVIHAWTKQQQIKKSLMPVTNPGVLSLFEQCKQMVAVKKPLVLAQSNLISSPLTFGLVKTYIILPQDAEASLNLDEIKHILLHELQHYKYKDIATNYLIILFQLLYWFNPLIWMAFREMRMDREIACDHAVLKKLDHNQRIAYGNTIIKFADKSFLSAHFSMGNQLASPKKQVKKRIERIADFKTETKWDKLKSILVFLLLAGTVVSQAPAVSAIPWGEDRIDFDNSRTDYEDLSAFFGEHEGSFVLYDLHEEKYTIYNEDRSTLRVSPNSTYKIYSALFALEAGVTTRDDSFMQWNGNPYPYESWNRNQTIYTAMENSVTWYFQQLDKKTKMKNIQSYLNHIQYGNQNVSGGIEGFWLESSLRISPIEQVQILKDFYTNEFGFDRENVQFIKDAIRLETRDGVTLYGKTGTGTVNGQNVNGWFIGYAETEQSTYFFATNIENNRHASGSKAVDITNNILRKKGLK
ncbi:BlaR1 family beta-lactam sensor/signal transducer [Jeotgalibacillus sp. ET6]|uniref:BlaR1 family beta-lactam sensor/signal transducer n=1 Tax=Jeotgalibacillus sp. ET6 TaxID=3037260 RepID=UPI002418B45D|nr:BlaR1 family beta-lactam sensor/signal transducer [Jeotgalibacillus sp. ET6]MDG5473165.1 BlaR1 family beta-lactam sensor/signal transducer [Jeotgalibacillus sp. ET6]